MAYKVFITEVTQENYDSCVSYVQYVLHQGKAAKDIKEQYDRFVENVSQFPEMYPKIPDERLINSNYRRALIKNYVVVYEFDGEAVTIHGFYHQLQDYARFVNL